MSDKETDEDTEKAKAKSIQECIERETVGDGRRLIHDEQIMWTFLCPHCDQFIEVMKNQVNCQIFRHAAYKNNINQPINPHTPKEICDKLVANDLVVGCAKPFRFVFSSQGNYVEICTYI